MMTIQLNGESHTVPPDTTLQALIQKLALPEDGIIVVHNDTFAPRDTWKTRALCDADSVEIVALVGGG